MPACERIWLLTIWLESSATSASRMRLSAAVRFSTLTPRLAMVCSRRFCAAPRSERRVFSVVIAVSISVMRAFAAVCLLLLMAPARAADGYTLDPETSRVRFQLHALGWWPVRGEARAEGVVAPEDERLRIDVRVPLASLQMGREGYRDWALSPEFFWAAPSSALFQSPMEAPPST